MFCRKCGAEIMDEAVICPKCGCATGVVSPETKKSSYEDEINKGYGMLLLLTILLGLLGFIIGIAIFKPEVKKAKWADYPTVARVCYVLSILFAGIYLCSIIFLFSSF